MEKLRSLKSQNHSFADSFIQLDVLENASNSHLTSFKDKLETIGFFPLKPTTIEVLQVNIGKMCNQTCKHCHVDAGPDRKEIMTRQTMEAVLRAVRDTESIKTVDITGGAPEMNPDFRWFLEKLSAMDRSIIVRCNLTIIVSNPAYADLPEFYRDHQVNVVSSLPHFSAIRTDAQRGEGVFDRSIRALKLLNEAGYGEDPELQLDLVYNPTGAFLPPSQASLEDEFRERLRSRYGVVFNNLFAITNMPISRFLDYLVKTGNYESYMEKLVNAFNPLAVNNLMCRSMISVGWDGYLYDCDFNQMLDLKVESNNYDHISEFNKQSLENRNIVVKQHCYGCTAGAGSSCGGELT